MLIFEICLPLKEPLVATFDETRALASGKSVVIQDISIKKSAKKSRFLWLNSSFFVVE